MAHLDLAGITYHLPDGRVLLNEVDAHVGEGQRVALIGPNGAGKSTLIRIATKQITPHGGAVTTAGEIGVMAQWVGRRAEALVATADDEAPGACMPGARGAGHPGGGEVPGSAAAPPPGSEREPTVQDLLTAHAPARQREVAQRLARAGAAMTGAENQAAQFDYAQALADWADVGGYQLEAQWDEICSDVLAQSWDRAASRGLSTLSGGESKRLVLSALLRSSAQILILDEPDNALDVPAKRWLEARLGETDKAVFFISHDREMLEAVATAVLTLEPGAAGSTAWRHGGGFAGYAQARTDRMSRLAELRRRWDSEHAQLRTLVQMYKQKASYNSDMASRLQAARTRLTAFEKAGPPQAVTRDQHVQMRLRGGRTAKRAVVLDRLALNGLTEPFDAEVWFGERVAVLGANGTGKSHLLRLLAGGGTDPDTGNAPASEHLPAAVAHSGSARLGSRVRPGWFAQQDAPAHLVGRTLLQVLHRGDGTRNGIAREDAGRVLDRYELAAAAEQQVQTLSGGQLARFQILLLELSGATLLLLDEATDNLDLHSAQALEQGLEAFTGTVLAITHDRWFTRSFDRFWHVGADGRVSETTAPVWDDDGAARRR
ncbi:ATP-binding cassette domain-containing protein [Pseudactinotalea sp. Z1739]|uniref:ATP-binding cassette domain-containing protein n=1 Tax=Pseudactinotalea sp. Z1739 TaxID=3413028 RepID=UPI003C7E991E